MSEATAPAQLPPDIGIDFEDVELVVEKPVELAIQCVLFVGNILSSRQMQAPLYRRGGKIFPFPDFYTVRNGIVPQCQITRLRNGFRSVHKQLIKEDQWGLWTNSYTMRNQWDPAEGRFRDITVGDDANSKDLLYKVIKPISELGRIAGQMNGVVALGADCGINSAADIKEAQFHYFPKWLEIVAGTERLPATLLEMQDYLGNRREQAQSASLRAIGDAFLLSCSDYYDWGKAYVDFQTALIEETKAVPGGVRYDEIAERMFKVLNLTRKDSLVQDMASNQQSQAASNVALADAITMMAKSQTKIDSVLSFIAERQLGVTAEIPEPLQPPAPVTEKEVVAEVEREIEDDITPEFTDMSDAVVDLETTPDETVDYLAEAGIEVEGEAPDDDETPAAE